MRIHQLQGETIFNAYLVEKDACAIIISYSGGTANLIDICQLLKEKRVPIISITSLGVNPISQLADVELHLSTKEKLYSKISTFSTDAAITYILDVLYSCVFAQSYDKNVKLRKTASQKIEASRLASSSVLKEDI
ncbi:SIS domain-containing protein [Streptococcus parauberis]|uniref:MurR/RpiR family transcriptional regulator n=1 Tax=Streptococcus parauberis TaxID=1348 RepID=UPI0009B717F7|nr:SIS domain-containing protein [Streptococcus parauberis]WOF48029.1 SIS domain-containing protein [Streptococcus parauberis]